ncbi:MAG: winged helix DNA-binding protein [Gammaproteobacteria bacterium]|nr:winged helix DNA-binding protein [Gammaproteobacteria bacterium]
MANGKRSPDRRPPADPGGLESHLGFWMRFVSNHVSAEFRKLVEYNGVSVSDWVALRRIFDDGTSSAPSLMADLGMTKGAVSKILARLEERGLIQRAPAETDRRAQRVSLTRAGKTLVPRLSALADRNDERFFGHLSAQESEMLSRVLREMVRMNNWKDIPVE